MKQPRKQKFEHRIAAALRIALVAVLLLLNIAAVVMLSIFLQANSAPIYLAMQLAGVIAAVNIQSKDTSNSYKLAWTLLILALPVAGLILYLLWGGSLQNRRVSQLSVKAPPGSSSDISRSQKELSRLHTSMPHWHRVATLLNKKDFNLFQGTNVTYFPGGEQFFEDAIARMAKAERFIFMEFFIIAEGKLFDRILEVLKERSAHGVEVKVIFDDFGSITRMSNATVQEMEDAGIEVAIFSPVHQYVNRLYFNYRDHRKIIAVDGQYAYTGGVNVADEYAGYIRRFGEWKDCGVLLDGMGAWGLTARFIHMWEMLGRTLHDEHDYYRPYQERTGTGWCQPFSDGPINNPNDPAEDVFLQCIHNAHEHIWLTTPYFAVEDYVVRALCMAADGGVDVRLLLPGIPDHKYTDIVAGSYYSTLMSHGVKIYRFTPGFLHAKSFVADGEVAMVGTVNMDYRSFQLHYECGVMLYGANAISDIRADMERVMTRSEMIDPAVWKKRPLWKRMLEKVLKLFSIWM